MDIFDNKYNETTIFMLPMLYSNFKYTDVLTEDFINCYIADINKPGLDEYLHLVFHTTNFSLPIPEEFIKDYKYFLRGKYSKFSLKLKKIILSFWNCNGETNLHSILFKTDKMKEYWLKKPAKLGHKYSNSMEYWPKPILINETFNLI
jgi:hypothetical protein